MPLPKIATPTYELVLPSSDRKIKYRPFLVKEEKILIIAMESEDQKQITNAIKSVINNCILTRGIKVDKLSTFDIEYLFLNIRGKSVGENVEVIVTCPDDNETEVSVIIPLVEIQVKRDPDHNKDIKLDDNLVMRMRYPRGDSGYKCDKTKIVKFNVDYRSEIEYTFFGLFPINLSSTPVQYGSSDVLRTNVTFSYERYIAGKQTSLSYNKKKSENMGKART